MGIRREHYIFARLPPRRLLSVCWSFSLFDELTGIAAFMGMAPLPTSVDFGIAFDIHLRQLRHLSFSRRAHCFAHHFPWTATRQRTALLMPRYSFISFLFSSARWAYIFRFHCVASHTHSHVSENIAALFHLSSRQSLHVIIGSHGAIIAATQMPHHTATLAPCYWVSYMPLKPRIPEPAITWYLTRLYYIDYTLFYIAHSAFGASRSQITARAYPSAVFYRQCHISRHHI